MTAQNPSCDESHDSEDASGVNQQTFASLSDIKATKRSYVSHFHPPTTRSPQAQLKFYDLFIDNGPYQADCSQVNRR